MLFSALDSELLEVRVPSIYWYVYRAQHRTRCGAGDWQVLSGQINGDRGSLLCNKDKREVATPASVHCVRQNNVSRYDITTNYLTVTPCLSLPAWDGRS